MLKAAKGGYKREQGERVANQAIDDVKTAGRRIKKGVTNYGKNVVGGAKIVGSAIKRKVLKAFKR